MVLTVNPDYDPKTWRTCSRCKKPKPPEAFSSVTSGYCRPCFRDYRREKYVPVNKRSKELLKTDRVWKAKHDAKTCIVCKRSGSETLFKNLHRWRCSDCEAKNLFWCKTHGRVRAWPCRPCTRKNSKAYRQRKKAAKRADAEKTVLLMTGDGACARCGDRVRKGKIIDRSHRCE
jgi:hypothetical protein